jgi:hypothetical protein
VLSNGSSHPGDGNHHDDGEDQEGTQGGEQGTGKRKRTKAGTGIGKGKWNGNCKGNGIVKQTPEGDDISRASALKLQREMYQADPDMES